MKISPGEYLLPSSRGSEWYRSRIDWSAGIGDTQVIKFFRMAAVLVGVVGGCLVAIAMLGGPLSEEPGPNAFERFIMFAYPICLVLGGIFALLRVKIGLLYGLLGLAFAAVFVVLMLTGSEETWGDTSGIAKVLYATVVVGPALILSSLCWSVMRETNRLATTTGRA
jgi:hypothetical protein